MTAPLWWAGLAALALAGARPSAGLSQKAEASQEEEAEALAEQVPDPVDEFLPGDRKDPVTLAATYYPPPTEGPAARGEETVPVILLHMYKGSRRDFHDLAVALQRRGHAVLVPDLRGHGDSTELAGSDQKLSLDRMRTVDFQAMLNDVQRWKSFLLKKNNARELNIDKLCLVGAELGAVAALNFAAYDWAKADVGMLRQGKDVKGLVLISPVASVKGFTASKALNSPAIQKLINVQVIVGADRKEADKIVGKLRKFRGDEEEQTVFYRGEDADLVGTRLLEAQPEQITQVIATFIKLRLVDKTSFAGQSIKWQDRTNPLASRN